MSSALWDSAAARGRPQLPTSQSFLRSSLPSHSSAGLRGLGLLRAQSQGSRARSSEPRSRPQEPWLPERRWRAWFLQTCPSPPRLGLHAAASARVPAGVQNQATVCCFLIPLLARWSPLPSTSPCRSSCSGPGAAPSPHPRALRSRQTAAAAAALTWVAEPGSGTVPQVVDEILAAVVLQGPTGTELGQQLQRLVTERVPGPGHRPPASSDLAGQAGAGDSPPPASSEPPPPGGPRLPPGTRQERVRALAPAGPASHRLNAALRQRVGRACSLSRPAPLSLPRREERRRRTAQRASLSSRSSRHSRPPGGGAGPGVRAAG